MNLLKPSTWGEAARKQHLEVLGLLAGLKAQLDSQAQDAKLLEARLVQELFKLEARLGAHLETLADNNAKLISDLGDQLALKLTGLLAVLGKQLEAQAADSNVTVLRELKEKTTLLGKVIAATDDQIANQVSNLKSGLDARLAELTSKLSVKLGELEEQHVNSSSMILEGSGENHANTVSCLETARQEILAEIKASRVPPATIVTGPGQRIPEAVKLYDVQIDENGRVAKLVPHGEPCEVPKGWRVKVRHLTQEEVAKIKKDLIIG